MEERTIYSWIHLADIHVGHGDASHGWNQARVMDALRRDVAAMPGPARVNWIVVTGDVAASGSPDEYARAASFLRAVAEAAQIDPMGIFVVPGNHDVNRDADAEREIGHLVDELRSGRASLDAALADAGDRARIAARMSAYLELAKDFAPWCWDPSPPAPEHRLFWMQKLRLPTETLRLRFVGLNTALLSKDETDGRSSEPAARTSSDRGKLQLGNEQLATALMPPVEPVGELVIALSHHPLTSGWIADQSAIHGWLHEHAHVHLSGHAHEADSGALRSGTGGDFVHVVAGTVRADDAPAGHGYNFCEIVHDGSGALELRVWPRCWSEAHQEFRADVESVPSENMRRGQPYASHRLRARLAVPDAAAPTAEPPAQPVAPTPAPKPPAQPPLDVFYVYAPEDEGLLDGLDTHLALLKKTGVIQAFDKRSIALDADSAQTIAARIRSTRVLLVLTSASFLMSDFFHGPLMDRALERAARGEAYVVPIYLTPCAWQDTKLAELEGLPRDGTPVSELDRDTAFADIAFELRHLFRPSKRRR